MRSAVVARFALLAGALIGGCADSYTPPPGTAIAWESERVEPSGPATPADTQAAGLPAGCRAYTQTVRIDGQEQQATGQACLQPDGSWRLTPPPGAAQATTLRPSYVYPPYPYYPYYPYYPSYYPYPYFPYYGSTFFGSAFFFDRSKNKGGHHRHHHRGGHGGGRGRK